MRAKTEAEWFFSEKPTPEKGRGGGGSLRFTECAILLLAWLLIPAGMMLLRGLTREAYLKFLLPTSLPLALLVGRGIVMGYALGRPVPGSSRFTGWFSRLIILFVTMAGLWPTALALRHLYFDPAYARDDYRALAAQIQSEAPPATAIILDAPNQWEVFTYYYPDDSNVYPLPDAHTATTVESILGGYEWVTALFWGDAEQDPTRTVERALNDGAFTLGGEWMGRVRVVRFFISHEPPEPVLDSSYSVRFGEHITLVDAALAGSDLRPGGALGVALTWQTDAALDARYKVFVHLYAPDGMLLAQHDGEPGGDLAPTTFWLPGSPVSDRHGLRIPPDAPEGPYRLVVGLYTDAAGRLPVVVGGESIGDALTLADDLVLTR